MEVNKRKRILLTTPNFYSYPEVLKKGLQDLGFEVVHFKYPKSHIFMPVFPLAKTKLLHRIYSCFKNDFDDFSKYCIANENSMCFDFLLSINIPISSRLIDMLKSLNPSVKTIIYVWDSLRLYNILSYISIYDVVFTFDLKDSVDFGLKYKINYWNEENKEKESEYIGDFDLVFIGRFSELRADMLVPIIQKNPTIKFYIRLFDKKIKKNNFYRRWLQKKDERYRKILYSILTDKKISIDQVNSLTNQARGIIDVESNVQYGMSQRVVLALAHKKKILTTNPYLLSMKECSNQILDIRKVDGNLTQWLDRPVEKYTLFEEVLKSELHHWIIEILDMEKS